VRGETRSRRESMNFTMDVGIALVVGIGLGFILCRVLRAMSSEAPHDTGPHKD
jgi:hypothetical protein